MAHERARRPLIEGHQMRCPRCKKLHDILQYSKLDMIEEFENDTTPVYKCPQCRWTFAPATNIVDYFNNLFGHA